MHHFLLEYSASFADCCINMFALHAETSPHCCTIKLAAQTGLRQSQKKRKCEVQQLITLFSRETYWDIEASKFLHAFLFQDPMHSTYVCLHVCLHANKLISHTEAAACDLKYEQAMISYLMTASG